MKHPNLLVVMADQMRGQTLEFLGIEPTITPHLNTFANESLVFTEAISNAPLCSPARAMFLTGMYPSSTGVLTNCNSQFTSYGNELKSNAQCWSDILKNQGYATAYIGKWHLDAPISPYIPCQNNFQPVKWNEWCEPMRRHGFDFWYSYGTYNDHLRPMYWTKDALRDQFHYVDMWGPEHETDLSIRYILNDKEECRDPSRPFVLFVSMNPPHPPYDRVPQKYRLLYKDRLGQIEKFIQSSITCDTSSEWSGYFRKYIIDQYAMITGIDEQFGRIMDVLKIKGIEDDTIVLFLSDHGDCLGIHGERAKDNPYEESIRIPVMIRWPGRIFARQDDFLISLPDLFPTLMSLMGLKNHIPPGLQGRDYSEFCKTGEGERPTSQFYYSHCFFSTKTKAPLTLQIDIGDRGIRTDRYTLVCNKGEDDFINWFLWDRVADPRQINNIAANSPELVNNLYIHILIPWLKYLNDPWLDYHRDSRMNSSK